ncbi:MAG: DUF302 domain-containing protein [Gammaproteobacteria bacterium]|nr:DUF302 domain-containing protein [Gammaproteobacteria bacterium]
MSESESGLIINTTEQPLIQNTMYIKEINKPAAKVYNKLFTALENNAYFVIHEPDVGKALARFKQRWGNDYNKNNIQSFRSLVFLNAWHANIITNADPELAALFPQHITILQINNKTHISYLLPGASAQTGPAVTAVKEMESEIIRLIDELVR